MVSKTIHLGGVDTERLYLKDADFYSSTGERVIARKSVIARIGDLDDMVARHIGRYSLVGLFCRPGFRILDFPCGSGYASDFLKVFGGIYEGLDCHLPTIEYANRVYGDLNVSFGLGDLTNPCLRDSAYDIIGCIEGLEHIERKFQEPLIGTFYKALKSGGILVVSSPENPTGKSGPSLLNKDHLWELNRADFLGLLYKYFGQSRVEIVSHQAILDPGGLTNCLYGVCHKIN